MAIVLVVRWREHAHAAARADRARAAFLVAPAPLPLSLPLLGPEGTDADGYPTRYVDRAGLRSLLAAGRFQTLDDDFNQLQTAFETDPRKEYWPIDASDAFASSEPELTPKLDAWVAASPDSFAPYLARGSHRLAGMWAMRGAKYASHTPRSDMRAMVAVSTGALADLDRALALRPKLVAAMRDEMRVAMAISDTARREDMRTRALGVCPSCLQIRATYLWASTPRWGGSYAAMSAFIDASPASLNPRFRVLGGFPDLDRAELLRIDKRYADALTTIQKATALGDYWEYLAERGTILERSGRLDEAIADLDRADALRPMQPVILAERTLVQGKRGKFVPAGRDLLTTLRIEPSNDDAKLYLPWVLQGVLAAAQSLDRGGKHEEALEAAELGLDLGPTDRQAHGVYATIVLGDATTPERIAELRRHVASQPGDYRAVQQLDYALSRQGRFADILPLWDAYLAVHPDDGRAHMERAGTYHQLGRNAEAIADAARACQLGVSEGCERAAGH